MLLYNNKGFITNSEHPDDDWIGNANYVVPDSSELAKKIMDLYPYFDFVTDEKGQLIDATATEPAPEPAPEPTLEERLAEQEATIATLEEKITELGTYNETLTECVLEMSEYVYK